MSLSTALIFGLALLAQSCSPMMVKSWGTTNHINRLVYSVRDLFDSAFQIMTLGQRGVYPLPNLEKQFPRDVIDVNETAHLLCYNGWLEDLKIDCAPLRQQGKLRRFIMTRMKKGYFDKHEQHEIIGCDNCLVLSAKGLHYGYEVRFFNEETTGELSSEFPLDMFISFQMTVISEYDQTVRKHRCNTELELLTLTWAQDEDQNTLPVRLSNVGLFSFLADGIEQWAWHHVNGTIAQTLRTNLIKAVNKSLLRRNPCKEFLSQ